MTPNTVKLNLKNQVKALHLRDGDPATGIRCHKVMEVISELLHSYVTICLAPGQSTSSLFILIHAVETINVCAALMLQCIMKWHFSSVSVCQGWLWKKCVIAALTTRWHSALRQIPRGLPIPQRTPLPSEKLGETWIGRGTDEQRKIDR